jgi:hypothetical protein
VRRPANVVSPDEFAGSGPRPGALHQPGHRTDVRGRPVTATGFLLVHVPEGALVHGRFNLDDSLVSVLYFNDIMMGLVVVAAAKGRVEFGRIKIAMATPAAAAGAGAPS